MSDSIFPGFRISDEELSVDEKTGETVGEIIIRIMLGELSEYHCNLLSCEPDEEDDDDAFIEFETIEL